MKRKLITVFALIAAALLLVSCQSTGGAQAKQRLDEAIGTLLPEDRYTAASYAPYKEAYDAAIELSKSDSITALAVDRAVDALSSAKKSLVLKNDFSELQRQVDFFNSIVESDYSKASYANYKEAYELALPVLMTDTAKQSEINTAASRMESAKRALQKIPDMSALRLLVETEVDPSIYTGESYEAYRVALEKGRSVLKKECPTLEELRLAENMLVEAYESLMLRGNTGDLSALINEVNTQTLTPDQKGRPASEHFAAKGYNAVMNALSAARACVDKGDASESEIGEAERRLREAVALLVDISPLLDAYDRGGEYSSTIDNKEYTESSYKRLSEVMSLCDGLMKNPDVSSEEVRDAVSTLNAVIESMEYVQIEPDGLRDKPVGELLVTVGRSSVILSDYMKDYSRFFLAVNEENADFAFNPNGDTIVFTRGACRAELGQTTLLLRYTGNRTIAPDDLSAFTVAGAAINETDRALMSDRFLGVPTEYSESAEGAAKIAYMTYVNDADGLSLTVRYDLKNKFVISFEFTFTEPAIPPETGNETPDPALS